uniref:Uncharacterized protein n=1 Tax=Rhizophagus irregularis (strain DAOM 181602 / DAOM 197198 / MUCL 43194) TaxID=747089 RepID=U9TJ32_RHIID
MSYGKNEKINNAIIRSYALMDSNIRNDTHKSYVFSKQIIHDDESLTENEKSEAITLLTKHYDLNKLLYRNLFSITF